VTNGDIMESCPGKIEVPTKEEREALAAMRAIKERVRDLKKRLAGLFDSQSDDKSEEILGLEKELADLKTQWNKWEEKNRSAAEQRMILLGHEPPEM
jgi:hypothetical protein